MCLLYSEVHDSIRFGNHRITIAGGTPFRRDQPLEQLSGDRSDLFTAQNAEFSRKFTYAPPVPAYSNVCIEMVPVPWRIYAKLTDGTGNVSKTVYLHCELQNCGSNFPIVPGNSQVVAQTAFDIKPNQSDGSILGQVIPNDLILCGNTSGTFWKVTPMKNSAQALTPAAKLLYQI